MAAAAGLAQRYARATLPASRPPRPPAADAAALLRRVARGWRLRFRGRREHSRIMQDSGAPKFDAMPKNALGRLMALRESQPPDQRKLWSPAAAVAVLYAIAEHADLNGKAWPSVPRLATMCDLSPRTVRYALDALEDAELLHVATRDGRCAIFHILFTANKPLQPVARVEAIETTSDEHPALQPVAGVPLQPVAQRTRHKGTRHREAPPPSPSPPARAASPRSPLRGSEGGRGQNQQQPVTEEKAATPSQPAAAALKVPRAVTPPPAEYLATADDLAAFGISPWAGKLAAREGVLLRTDDGGKELDDLRWFEEVWSEWPKKVSPQKAFRAWHESQELRRAPLEEGGTVDGLILFGAEQEARKCKDKPRYDALCLHVWLAGERWNDYAAPYSAQVRTDAYQVATWKAEDRLAARRAAPQEQAALQLRGSALPNVEDIGAATTATARAAARDRAALRLRGAALVDVLEHIDAATTEAALAAAIDGMEVEIEMHAAAAAWRARSGLVVAAPEELEAAAGTPDSTRREPRGGLFDESAPAHPGMGRSEIMALEAPGRARGAASRPLTEP